jgi:solute carrier family 25 uncoupling protein 8/9
MERELFAGGVSVGMATACTNPIDVVKVRMQMHCQPGRSLGFFETAHALVTREGVRGLTGGLSAAVLRGVTYGGIRLGMYEPLKPLVGADKPDASLARKILASCVTGATAAALTNPMDLVKTRNQIASSSHSSSSSFYQTVKHVCRHDGVFGLWRGCIPGVTRASILTSSQLVTYGETKKVVGRVLNKKGNCFETHLATSMVTGLVATTATNPVDVIKTRIYSGTKGKKAGNANARGPSSSSSFLRHVYLILTQEGARGFFKGWSASYLRIGPQTCITFLIYEQMRRIVGLKQL